MTPATLTLLAALGLADPSAVFRTPVVSQGPIEPAEVQALEARLDDGLAEANFEIRRVSEDRTCDEPACWQAEASASGAAYALAVEVDATEADQRLSLRVTDVATGTTVVELSRTCELCGRDELRDAVSDLAASGMRKLRSHASVETTLVIDSVPTGATVRIDGTEVGTTPVEVEVDPGPHDVELAVSGHETVAQSLDVERGTSERLRLYLSPTTPPPAAAPTDREPRRGRVVAGAALIGGGFASLAAGVTLLVLHGRPITRDCDGTNVDLDGDCHYLHDTRLGGGIAVGVGAAALVAGSVVLGLELRRDERASVSLVPGRSGVAVRGRF